MNGFNNPEIARARINLEAERDRLRLALEAVEWQPSGSSPYCRACGQTKFIGHAPDCIVGLALEGA